MKKYIFTLLSLAALSFTSCDDVLDRPQLTKPLIRTIGEAKQISVCMPMNVILITLLAITIHGEWIMLRCVDIISRMITHGQESSL